MLYFSKMKVYTVPYFFHVECMFYVGMNLRVGLILLNHSNGLHLAENDGLPYDYFFPW